MRLLIIGLDEIVKNHSRKNALAQDFTEETLHQVQPTPECFTWLRAITDRHGTDNTVLVARCKTDQIWEGVERWLENFRFREETRCRVERLPRDEQSLREFVEHFKPTHAASHQYETLGMMPQGVLLFAFRPDSADLETRQACIEHENDLREVDGWQTLGPRLVNPS